MIDADRLMSDVLCTFYNDLDDLNRTEKLINEAPTVEERQHGEWIYHKYDKDFECSMCHYRFDEDEFGLEIPQENGTWVKVCVYNFCPNCGADMRKGDENV